MEVEVRWGVYGTHTAAVVVGENEEWMEFYQCAKQKDPFVICDVAVFRSVVSQKKAQKKGNGVFYTWGRMYNMLLY